MVKTSDVIADFLKYKGIEVAFSIIGSANAHIFDSISKLGYTKIVNVHHEQAAVLAAGAYYRTNGRLAAAIVTAGAGASNAITGVLSNWADSIPCFILSGQEQSKYITEHKDSRMIGTQGFDIAKMVKDITKYSITVTDEMNPRHILETAYMYCDSYRPGPVWVDFPMNIQSKMVDFEGWLNPTFETWRSDTLENVQSVCELIKQSNRPVILGGHGIKLSKSKKEFVDVVNISKIPTLLTWSGIDLLEHDNPNFFGRPGLYGQRSANFIIQNCDLLIVIGSRLALPQVGYDFSQFARSAKIVVVDIDENELSKYKSFCHMTINADCNDFLYLLKKSIQSNYDINEWREYCENSKDRYPLVIPEHIDNGYINAYKFIDKLSDKLKDDHIITTDMGTALLCGHQNIRLKKNQTMFTSLGLGEMGYGLPGAIGAAFACPNRDVLCLNCDGGIMMNIQELHTIVENGLNVKVVIFNNDGYLMIKHTQKMMFNGKYVSVDKKTGIGLPDFSKVLPAFGYKYFELKTWDNFDKTVEDFLNHDGQSVLEVFMDPEQDFIPKVKGVVKDDNSIFAPPIEEMSPILPLSVIEDEMISGISEKSKLIKRCERN